MTAAARLLDAIVPIVRTRLPRGVDVDYLDDFLDRNRFALEAVIEQNLSPVLAGMQAANNAAFVQEDIPDPERSGGGRKPPRAEGDEKDVRFWTVAKRTAANIAAMSTAANLYAQRRVPTADERAVLAGYSGWGSRSIQAAAGEPRPRIPDSARR